MTATAIQIKIPAGTWSIDPVHSSASFEVEHNGFSLFRASFRELDARLTTGAATHIDGKVDVESIDVEQPDFRAHLLSPEFFDANRHPYIRFSSDDLTADESGAVLRGELTIAGQTHPVEASGSLRGPLTDAFGGERFSLSLEANVDRHQYGIGWNMDLPNGRKVLGDDVKLLVELELVKE